MHPSSAENKMPHSFGRTLPGAMKLNAEDDEFILEEIHQCDVLEHEEWNTDNEISDVKEEYE